MGTPTHLQPTPAGSRLALQAIGVTYANATTANAVSPNTTGMFGYANGVLNFNGLPLLTKVYTPNEMPSLLHDLQVRLGI